MAGRPRKRQKMSGRRRRTGPKSFKKRRGVNRTLAPTKRLVHLRYVEQVELAGVAGGAMQTYYFTANGMFDPNITGTGHQPLGFDQYMSMYNHYTVIKSKCTVHFNNVGNLQPMVVGVNLDDNATTITSAVAEFCEQPSSSWKYVNVGDGAGTNNATLSRVFNPKKNLGISHPMSEHDCRGNAAANPAEQSYYVVFSGPQNVGSDTGVILVFVTIDYWAVLTEPKELAQS